MDPVTHSPSLLAAILARDLASLRDEILAYPADELLWRELPALRNPAGNLALHLAGNLQHFIGALLAQSGYVRDRPAEFSRRDATRAEVAAELDRAAAAVATTLATLPAARLDEVFPIDLGGPSLTTQAFLLHLIAHLAYHLGQIDYHRRLVTGEPGNLTVLSPGQLAERLGGRDECFIATETRAAGSELDREKSGTGRPDRAAVALD